jgi:hypothetical protein
VTPAELRTGDVVRILGLYRRRRVTIRLDRMPVEVDSGAWLLCGYEALADPRGHSRRFHARFVEADADLEVLEEGPPRYRRAAGSLRLEPVPRPAPTTKESHP